MRREPARAQTGWDYVHPDDTAPSAGSTRCKRRSWNDQHPPRKDNAASLGGQAGATVKQSGQLRLRLREIVAKNCWRAARFLLYLFASKLTRVDLKPGGMLWERAVGIEKRVAPELVTR